MRKKLRKRETKREKERRRERKIEKREEDRKREKKREKEGGVKGVCLTHIGHVCPSKRFKCSRFGSKNHKMVHLTNVYKVRITD